MVVQTRIINWLERFSPVGATKHLAEGALGTDYGSYLYLINNCRRFRETLLSYITDKLNGHDYRIVSSYPQDKLPTEYDYITRITDGKYSSLSSVLEVLNSGGKRRYELLSTFMKNRQRDDKPEPLTLDDLPAFDHRREPLLAIANRRAADLCILFGFHVLVFFVGFLAINRYDPR
jgi:hypothetical protein